MAPLLKMKQSERQQPITWGGERLPRRRKRRGVVIVVVTVVILLVSLAAYGFLTLMQTENKAAAARGDQLQAQAVAASGREYLAAILELPRGSRPAGTSLTEGAELFGNITVDGEEDDMNDESARVGRFSVLAPNYSEMAAQGWRFGYENESAKLHLGQLLLWEKRDPQAARQALMNLPNMDESTADSILDWIDADDQQRDQGAESEYYQGLSPPRNPRNAVPPSLEELLLVKGVTREKLFGIDVNANFVIDQAEEDMAREQAEMGPDTAAPWCHYLTVLSGERDETYDGQPRIVLNQDDVAKLHRELSAALEPAWANFIVAYRQYGPYKGSGKRRDSSELPLDLARPAQRRLRSPLELIGRRVGIPREQSGGKRKGKKREPEVDVFDSPFSTDASLMREYLPRLLDAVTVGSGSPVIGRVNVNLAPPEVLAALPGLDASLADQIIAARTVDTAESVGPQHAVWLLTEGILSRGTMLSLDPYVTIGGDVGRAQIIGYYDRNSPIARFETVINGTEKPARQVYYKDLRRLGRGVVGELLEEQSTP